MNLLVLEFEIDLLSLQARVNYAKWVTGGVGRILSWSGIFFPDEERGKRGWMGGEQTGVG